MCENWKVYSFCLNRRARKNDKRDFTGIGFNLCLREEGDCVIISWKCSNAEPQEPKIYANFNLVLLDQGFILCQAGTDVKYIMRSSFHHLGTSFKGSIETKNQQALCNLFYWYSIWLLDINQINKIYIVLGKNNTNPAPRKKTKKKNQNGEEAGGKKERKKGKIFYV